ncbi:MAG: translation initiation factor IF-3 [Desulfobacterota bacterium]|nr:translation initiation factor IF-3 [Thermodesulfobacteriota bacterium]MDW8002004.1 translation initiation factor IF-3 [Deltaproteobacteria bacterium]
MNVNEKIKAKEVRVVDETGKQLGIMPLSEALRIAREKDLDLVEVAPKSEPPVCKIMDFGKYKYQLAKKAHEAKKKQTIIHVKEMKIGLKIEDHDLNFKIKHIKEFLSEGHKVKVVIVFKGREIQRVDMGEELANKIIKLVEGVGQVEVKPKLEGKNIVMVFAPA